MKRTVTRYISDDTRTKILGGECRKITGPELSIVASMPDRPHHLDLTVDDGKPEPAGQRCPCGDEITTCCRSKEMFHCVCHGGTSPCLSDFHKPAPATRDRRVEGHYNAFGNRGCTAEDHEAGRCAIPPTPEENGYYLGTLIIHEPVKEPSLYEAVKALIQKRGVGIPGDDLRWDDLLVAFNREKAAREKAKP